jgi:hypothetical protein
MVSGHQDPAFTVASFATTTTSRRGTIPTSRLPRTVLAPRTGRTRPSSPISRKRRSSVAAAVRRVSRAVQLALLVLLCGALWSAALPDAASSSRTWALESRGSPRRHARWCSAAFEPLADVVDQTRSSACPGRKQFSRCAFAQRSMSSFGMMPPR